MTPRLPSQTLLLALLCVLCLAFVSCAPGELTLKEYGFLHGLWHGFIAFFSIIGKFLGLSIGVYAQNVSGWTYWLGFAIGVFFYVAFTIAVPVVNFITWIVLGFGLYHYVFK
ncbi:MAG: hypothetical protein IT260_24310 [Saprospiraceae bacterium]|nr:hypothetical protein [Saprospiraceae bacterium]